MQQFVRIAATMLVILGAAGLMGSWLAAQEGGRRGTVLALDGAVTPTVAGYLDREITAASARDDELVLIEIDTPGGLVTSMQSIVKTILTSEVPVVTYVSPSGARSASAGLYIMYAAHVSAMAPATNTGSATPVQIGGSEGFAPDETGEGEPDTSNDASMRGKVIEDSVAYIRGLAQLRGRNEEWAEKAVRPPSASITAEEALELNVIEIVADDRADLLEQLDGRTVDVLGGKKVLETEGLRLVDIEPSTLERVLAFFADPNVAAILLSLGTLGLTVELWNPGSLFPGVFGVICLLLAFYSFQVLPENGLFLGVLGIGLTLLVLEAFLSTAGLAGAVGLGMIGVGLYYLFPEQFRISVWVLVGCIIGMGVFLAFIFFEIVKSRSHGPLIGGEAIAKRLGRVESWDTEEGWVIVDGERWRARSKEPLAPGDKVQVQRADGLVLIVRKATSRSRIPYPINRPEAR